MHPAANKAKKLIIITAFLMLGAFLLPRLFKVISVHSYRSESVGLTTFDLSGVPPSLRGRRHCAYPKLHELPDPADEKSPGDAKTIEIENQLKIERPLPRNACDTYKELRDLNFLHKSIKEHVCQNAVAFNLINDSYPLCILKQQLPDTITDDVIDRSVKTSLKSPLTGRNITMIVYSGSDKISDIVRKSHTIEEENVRKMQRIIKKFSTQSPVTFVDVGSNVGEFTLPALELGVPVVALDANIRNLVRIQLSSEAHDKRHNLKLVWNAIGARVDTMYLNFPQGCNIGGATMLESKVKDTIPVMTTTADSLAEVIKTKVVVLRVDINGYEGEFFKTANKLFDSLTIAVVHMKWLRRHMNEEQRLYMIKFFTDHHYRSRSMSDLNSAVDIQDADTDHKDVLWIQESFL